MLVWLDVEDGVGWAGRSGAGARRVSGLAWAGQTRHRRMACSQSKSKAELLLLRNTGEGGEGTSSGASTNTNASRSVLPPPITRPRRAVRVPPPRVAHEAMAREHGCRGGGAVCTRGAWCLWTWRWLCTQPQPHPTLPLKLLAEPTCPAHVCIA
jgi:hypothetical protein